MNVCFKSIFYSYLIILNLFIVFLQYFYVKNKSNEYFFVVFAYVAPIISSRYWFYPSNNGTCMYVLGERER